MSPLQRKRGILNRLGDALLQGIIVFGDPITSTESEESTNVFSNKIDCKRVRALAVKMQRIARFGTEADMDKIIDPVIYVIKSIEHSILATPLSE